MVVEAPDYLEEVGGELELEDITVMLSIEGMLSAVPEKWGLVEVVILVVTVVIK